MLGSRAWRGSKSPRRGVSVPAPPEFSPRARAEFFARIFKVCVLLEIRLTDPKAVPGGALGHGGGRAAAAWRFRAAPGAPAGLPLRRASEHEPRRCGRTPPATIEGFRGWRLDPGGILG